LDVYWTNSRNFFENLSDKRSDYGFFQQDGALPIRWAIRELPYGTFLETE